MYHAWGRKRALCPTALLWRIKTGFLHVYCGVSPEKAVFFHISVMSARDTCGIGPRSKPSLLHFLLGCLENPINENLGPDYLPLAIPSGRDYLPLRLLFSSWDCNRRRWDHIKCDSPEPPSSACLGARGSICLSQERLGGAPARTSLDLAPRVSHHISKHLIETQKLSPLLCFMRVNIPRQETPR